MDTYNLPLVLLGSVLIAMSALFIFYFLIEKHIEKRIKLLYRIIRKGKTTTHEPITISLQKDLIEAAEKETETWAL